MTKQQQSLGAILQQRRGEALVADAEVIWNFVDGEDRTHHAEMLIREAMLQQSLGNIDQRTQYKINSILAFAMPEPDAIPDHF